MCGFATAEAALIVAQHCPSLLSTHLLLLLPAAAPAAFRLTAPALAGCLLGTAGGALRVACHRALGRFFTWQVAVREDHALVTRGPYAVVRHPSYAAWVVMQGGNVLLLLGGGSLFREAGLDRTLGGCALVYGSVAYLAVLGWNLLARMKKEDMVLQREFGEEWNRWAQRTPYRLIPWIY